MPHSNNPLLSWRFAEIKRVPDIVRYWGEQRPDKIALMEGNATRTYAELNRRSSRIANGLLRHGVRRGSNIGYIGKNSIEFFEIWFAAGKAGCAIASFNWRCAAAELVTIIDDAEPPLMFVSRDFIDVVTTVQTRCSKRFEIVVFDTHNEAADGLRAWIATDADTDPRVALGDADTALLSYTSGTTGQPKGVMASHEAFYYSFLCGVLEPAMIPREDDVMLMSMPNFHLGGSWLSMGSLYHGAALSILPAFVPGDFLSALRRDRATLAPLVPAAIQLLLNSPDVQPGDFSSLRSVIYFGSPTAAEIIRQAGEAFDCDLHQIYGTTESWCISILRHDQHDAERLGRFVSCGQPLPLVSVRIVDTTGVEVSPETIGEVLVRTPMALTGYWNHAAATANAMQDGWYHTGDLGRQDEEGFLYLVDRVKDMIISGGENIYSTEVEQAIQQLSCVRQCAVVGLPDEKWGERVVAAIVRDDSAQLSKEEVIDHCRDLIAGYKVPKQVIFLPALPMSATGKINKRALRDRLRKELAINP